MTIKPFDRRVLINVARNQDAERVNGAIHVLDCNHGPRPIKGRVGPRIAHIERAVKRLEALGFVRVFCGEWIWATDAGHDFVDEFLND